MEDRQEPCSAGSSRKAYPVSFKLSVVQFAEENSKNKAADKFCVSRSRVQQWVSQKDELAKLNPASKRVKGGGRTVKDDVLDQKVLQFIMENRAKQLIVTRSMIRRFAKSIGHPGFVASCGWLDKFLTRHQLSSQKATSVCQTSPLEYQNSLVDFLLQITKLRQQEEHKRIHAADKTDQALGPSTSGAVTENGAEEVAALPAKDDVVDDP